MPSEFSYPDETAPEWEQDLPDDLRALAAQLSADAAHLAGLYPGGEAAHKPGASETPWHRRLAAGWGGFGRWTAAAALLAGCGWWMVSGSLSWNDAGHDAQTAAVAPAIRKPAGDAEEPVSLATAKNQNVEATSAAPSLDPNRVVPAGIFQTLSSPEQEALLDLIEQEDLGQSSLSI